MQVDLDLIWNISLVCPWDCEFCCTDAVQVSKRGKNIIMSSNGYEGSFLPDEQLRLRSVFIRKYPGIEPNKFDLSLMKRIELGLEPTLDSKMKILERFKGYKIKIDFAGGEPLVCYENYLVIKEAARIFGAPRISVTSTGVGVQRYGVSDLANLIGVYEFTYDEPKSVCDNRPLGYNSSNIKVARYFSEAGVRTKAQIPLHAANVKIDRIDEIYKELNEIGATEILLMRLFPVGRGASLSNKASFPSKEELVVAINRFLELSDEGVTNVRLQCALKHLVEKNIPIENPCDMMRKSFGINYQGKLLVSAWGNGENGTPINNDFVLGDLCSESFESIRATEKFDRYYSKLNENYGHCKVISYLNASNGEDGFFEKKDPLYLSY